MANKITSVARRIMYTHVPKDGRSPVYNTITDKWDYVVNPTEAQLTTSSAKLLDIGQKSANAVSKADTAKQVADSKATADEAVSEVKTQMFEVYDINGTQLVADNFNLEETERGWVMSFCAHKALLSPGTIPAPFCLDLAYALKDDLADLEARVAAIEKKLGIS